ncbi:very-long-chain enoyl-CoA reductase [Elysia marginata]|uniref:Very-long-chain enoyl-CoA reductase n=1 Tax=Elysia marginata TaxID=1093978 RepID=A0AAV4FW56_9GAST|nr:very-long-chain enoyl-CoA reductase [Elysia marginata]
MLLNTIRKALSKIVLERIRPHVEQYLSHSQSGFRPNRSTSDVAWTHKWLAAKVNIENIAIKIAGIDMSAAFDTINRETLLKILEDIVNEDEHRIIRFLLSNTIIDTKIIGATEKKPFFSNVGTPQGDSLSLSRLRTLSLLATLYQVVAKRDSVRRRLFLSKDNHTCVV